MAYYKGFSFSFDLSSVGIFSKKTDEDVVRDSIKQILLTGVGSRVMRRDFGSSIYGIVFDNIGQFLDSVVSDSVATAIRKFEPRVEIRNITVTSNEDKGLIDVLVDYVFNGVLDKMRVTFGNTAK